MAERTFDDDLDEDAEQGEHIISPDDILIEVDGDDPMDEEDESADELGELTSGSSSHFKTNSVQIFTRHTASVFAVAGHPTEPLAISGGEDDLGYIWDITDGEVIVKLTGHIDSVTCVAWSSDGEMVSTGGMDGKVRIWRRVGKENYKTWEFLTELLGPDEVTFLRWHPKGNVLLAGGNDSTVWLWQLPSGNTMQVFVGHSGPVNSGDFTPDGKRIITACAEGTLIFWDPRSPTPIFKLSSDDARFNLDGITFLKVNPSSTLVVVGGATGGVRVVNLNKGEVVGALGGHTEGESVEAIEFVNISGNPGAGVVVTGATDGKACVWDLSTMRLRLTLEHGDAVTKILTHPAPKDYLIISGSADKRLCTWDARTGTLIREHKGHRAAVLDASLGLGGSVVISAGDDSACMVFTTEPTDDD